MKFHNYHFTWLFGDGEFIFVVGIAIGRVNYAPEARWLYSLRFFFGICKFEILWKTGQLNEVSDEYRDAVRRLEGGE